MPRLVLNLLGGFEARLAPGAAPLALPKKTQALVAYLALARRPVARTELATLLWGETGRTQAQQSLRQTLSNLRQALGKSASALTADAASISLPAASLQLDAQAFEALARKGGAAALAEAAALYRGDLLAGIDIDEGPFEDWLMAQRERLRELAMNGLTQLLADQTRAGALDDAIASASRLLAIDALHEPAHRALMTLYLAQGRRPAALRQYQTCVAALRRELGVEPTAETKQVYAELLREAAAGAASPAVQDAGERAAERSRAGDRERMMRGAAAGPFVGRDTEIERVRRRMAEAFGGRPTLVVVSGEAGVGKTRLLRQVAAEAAEQNACVLIGRAYRAEQILPLGPWRDALREAAVLQDPAVAARLTPQARGALARLVPELEGAGDAAGPEDPARVFDAMTRLVETLAAKQPVALLLEDLHWADDMTLRLLAYLARRLGRQPVLILATVREEDLEDAPAVRTALADLERESGVIALSLAPLSREATAALVHAYVRTREAPELRRLAAQVWDASEGNAFMAVEILRAAEDGVGSPASTELPLPERARQVVTGRLERLGETARGLLGVASVIGRDFEFGLAQRAAQLDEYAAAGAVEELVRRRVFRVVGERFEFTHDRIREIVYGQMLAPRRRLVHRQVAQAIGAHYAAALEPHYAALGNHAFEGELWTEAADWYRRAGQWAMARSFNREAAAAFERAVAALDRAPEAQSRGHSVDVRLLLRNALVMSGELGRSLVPLEEAQRLADALGDPLRRGRVGAHVSSDRWWRGRPDEALAAAQAVASFAQEIGDPALAQAAVTSRGYAFHGMGHYREVHQTLEPLFAAPHAAYGRDVLPIVSPLHQAIAALAHCGEFELALARAKEAVSRAEAQDHRYLLLHACWTLGEVHTHRGDAAQATPHLERALGMVLDRSDFFIASGVLGCLGYVRASCGRVDEGITQMRDALGDGQAWRIGSSRLQARLAEACLLAGRTVDAQHAAQRCLEATRRAGERGYEAWAMRLLGEIALGESGTPGDAARSQLATALERSEEVGMMPMAAHCHAGLARFHRRRGEAAAARQHRAAAEALYAKMGMDWWLGKLDLDWLGKS